MARVSLLPKVVLWLMALSVLAALFLRSAQSVREAPFTVDRTGLGSWSLVLEPDMNPLGAWLALMPPPQLAPSVGRQIFSRAGESVHYPNPASMPLILRSEFDRAFAGVLTPDAVMSLAQTAGFESTRFEPRCMARRRVSEPGSTRSVYFVVFDAPAFGQFRQSVSESLRSVSGGASSFDPAALSPVLMVAATDENFSQWLLSRRGNAATPDVDCIAPIEVL
jgi:hypothetical protein